MPGSNGNGRKNDGITRKDFLDGAAITAAGLAVAAANPGMTGAQAARLAGDPSEPLPPGYYPPSAKGRRFHGQSDRLVSRTMRIDGRPIDDPDEIHSTDGGPGIHRDARDTGEVYDCVIVGAGASGLSSAKFYRDRFGPDSKILLIDPMADFGGHSHRNEWHIPNQAAGGSDVMILRNGGTVNLDSIGTWNEDTGNLMDIPGEYGQPALDLLEFCGVDWEDDSLWEDGGATGIPSTYGLRQMLLFPREDFAGTDYCIPARNQGAFAGLEPSDPAGWQHFLNRTPYSEASRESILRVQTGDEDWLDNAPGAPLTQEQKVEYLANITYKRYLMHHIGVTEEAFQGEYQRGSGSLLGAGGQAVSAGDCWALFRPGFPDALGLPDIEDIVFPGIGRTPQMGAKSTAFPSRDWPDGNISLLRLLVSKLIPQAIDDVEGERPNQITIVEADTDYSQLDRRGRDVRIRLNSYVYRVKPGREPGDSAKVDYIDGDGKARRVRGTHVVMACWNRITAKIVEGLPGQQVEDLCYARKVPLIYGRAGLRNWQAFADAHISSVSPRGTSLFWDSTSLSAGQGFGPPADPSYGPTPADPAAPASLSFTVVPNADDAVPQLYAYETGRQQLLEKSYDELEADVIDVLDRSVNENGGDFDPERDVHTWMLNRWNYGYAHEFTGMFDPSLKGPWEDQPHRRGSVPFRNVSIGNADSQAFAYTHSAIQEGHRAVQDLPDAPSRRIRTRRRMLSAR